MREETTKTDRNRQKRTETKKTRHKLTENTESKLTKPGRGRTEEDLLKQFQDEWTYTYRQRLQLITFMCNKHPALHIVTHDTNFL